MLYKVLVLAEGDEVGADEVERQLRSGGPDALEGLGLLPLGHGFKLAEVRKKLERHYLQKALKIARTRKEAAALLGLNNDNDMIRLFGDNPDIENPFARGKK